MAVRGLQIVASLLLGFAMVPQQFAVAFEIVADGVVVSSIVVPSDPLKVVASAAKELQGHVALATGAQVPILQEGEVTERSGLIYLGACRASKNAGLDPSGLAPNGYLIKTIDGNLFVVGDDSEGEAFWIQHGNRTRVGTLFGVYDLLESELNARWLWPGTLGTRIDHVRDLRLPDYDVSGAPPFIHARWRDGSFTRAGIQGWASQKTRSQYLNAQGKWLRRHRFAMGRNMDMAHAFTQWWEKYGDRNPEFFNLLPDGTRRSDPHYHGGSDHLIGMSVGEPTFHKAIVENWLESRSEETVGIDCSENDTPGKCLCAMCLAMDVPDPSLDFPWQERVARARTAFEAGEKDWVRNLGSLSDRYARFYLAVQAEARKHDQNAVVMGYAYSNYHDPPFDTMLNDGVIIGIVPSLMFPWAPEDRSRMRRQWDGWSATGARLFLRPNYMLDGHNLPINFARKLGEDFTYAAAHGLIGTDFDSLNGQWSTQGPNLYMLGRLQGAPELEVDAVLKEYHDAFGPAAKGVASYFEHWERVTNGVASEEAEGLDLHWSYFYRNADAIYTPAVMEEAGALLAKARKDAAGDDLAEARVSYLEDGLRNVELTLAAQVSYRDYKTEGDLEGFAESVSKLDDYRATVESRFVANMAYLVWAEDRTWNRSLLVASTGPDALLAVSRPKGSILKGGGFENGVDAWGRSIMKGEHVLSIDDEAPFEGTHTARITRKEDAGDADTAENSWARWYQTGIKVDGTKRYEFQCRIRTTHHYTGTVKVWVTGTKEGTMEAKHLSTSGAWRGLLLDGIEPAGEEVGIYLNAMAGAGTVWFDAVTLAEKQ
jgi:hypothetical protein